MRGSLNVMRKRRQCLYNSGHRKKKTNYLTYLLGHSSAHPSARHIDDESTGLRGAER